MDPLSAAGYVMTGRSPGSQVVVLSFGLPGYPVTLERRTRRSQLRGQPKIGTISVHPYLVPF
jgi:hypothetical protein